MEQHNDVAVANADFVGGPPDEFDRLGREQLGVLLDHGLTFESRLLDVGCGALRGGRWVIPLLDPGHYCGIEPQPHMVERGLREFVSDGIVELKQPRFDYNDQFDFSVFGVEFTHFIARSVWSHTSKQQIELMLDGVAAHGTSDCVCLASFCPAGLFGAGDYKGDGWIGKSHESTEGGIVRHSLGWIRKAAAARGLQADIVRTRRVVRGQPWCIVTRG
ncbi:MAG: class I SAM-dependent methyltransferase [Planctomycetota bacterium]